MSRETCSLDLSILVFGTEADSKLMKFARWLNPDQEEQTRLDVVQGLFRVVAVLSHKDQDSDGVFLPEPLKDLFPKTAADFLISVALVQYNMLSLDLGDDVDLY